jgi:hypothetical protein
MGYFTLRFAGLFNLPIPIRFAFRIGVSQLKGAHQDYCGLTGDYNKDAPKFSISGASLQFLRRGTVRLPGV